MKSKGPGCAVFYRWRRRPGTEASFIEAWSQVSQDLLLRVSLGFRLHRGPDDIWCSCAQWPSAAARDPAFALSPGKPEASRAMEEAIAERLPEVVLESVADFLVSGGEGAT
jgi:hypothetical protein